MSDHEQNESLGKTLEMVTDDFGGKSPCAYLFCSGAVIYFNQDGKQMCDLQVLGLSGLHKFLQIYPQGYVYWAIFRKDAQHIPKECLETLLKYIKPDVRLIQRTEGGSE